MSEYKRDHGDIDYRRVYLFTDDETQEFTPFSSDNQRIVYADRGEVLEVRNINGETKLFYNPENVKDIVYGVRSNSRDKRDGQERQDIWISSPESEKTCARIWLRERVGSPVEYKLPNNVIQEEGCMIISVPNGKKDIVLVGDKYFNKAYRLVRA